MATEMNQADLDSEIESARQMVELQPFLPSQPSGLSSNHLPQQQHVVEDEVTKNIKEIIRDCGDGFLLPDCCIYKVPFTLRDLNEEAYTPKVVSIGPFHYGNQRLQDMENHKQILFKRFIGRSNSSLDGLVHLVKSLEPKVRASYSESINLTEQELVKITLMDAGFIIQLFTMSIRELHKDTKLSQSWLEVAIIHDLLLLENQLPFFVIEDLYNIAFPQNHHGSRPSLFLKLTYQYFGFYNRKKLEPNRDVKIKHFADLLRLFYLPENMSQRNSCTEGVSHFLLYNANALHEAGIKLKATMNSCLLDLKFSGHTLEIPQIVVDDYTELLFRNMIALEQCHYSDASYITDYALVLDCLVDTHKDVNLLVQKKVINNYLGDTNDVALLFNRLWKNVNQQNFNSEYRDICQRLNDYCQNPRHKMKATLRRDYCNTPWRTVASIAGIILLVLTIVQTIFSVLQVGLK